MKTINLNSLKKEQFRYEFDTCLANKNETLLEQNINYLLTIFVKFFSFKYDKERLVSGF